MIIVIIFNSLSLAFYDYKDRNSQTLWNQHIDEINVVCTFIFIAESALKIIAFGLIIHPLSYLKNGWNIIDSVVIASG